MLLYSFSVIQVRFERIIVIGSDLENVLGLNVLRDDFYNALNESNECESSLVIFDDVIFNPRIMNLATEFFTRGRHKKLSLIFCTQNLFLADKTLNLTVVFLLRI